MELKSTDDFEPMDDFERDLREALQREPAPAGLKRKVMQRREQQRAQQIHGRAIWWQRIAATVVMAGAVGGAMAWHNAEQRRRGEEMKQQVFTALRITNHALREVNAQLNDRDTKE